MSRQHIKRQKKVWSEREEELTRVRKNKALRKARKNMTKIDESE